MPFTRDATESDIAAITDIYAHHVRHSSATFEIDPPDRAEMSRRRAHIVDAGLPYLVIDVDGAVAGYAYAGRYRPRPAYRFTVEDSVYIHPELRGRGYGQLLLARLIELCEAARNRQMVAIIGDSANTPSIRLHAKLGFRNVGVLEAAGRKFGRWIDTVIMQRALYVDARLAQIRRLVEQHDSRNVQHDNRRLALQQVADFIRQIGTHRWVGLYEVDSSAGQVRNLVYSGPGMPAHPVFSIDAGITGAAIREGRTVNVGDVASDPHYLTAFRTTRSEIIVPVFDGTKTAVIGTIDVESEKPQAFPDEDQIFLEDCAEAVSSIWGRD